ETLARAVLGYDKTFSMGTDFSTWIAEPSATARWVANDRLTVGAGLLGTFHKIDQGAGALAATNPLSMITAQLAKFYVGSAYAEVLWRPTPRWLLRPGVRADVNADGPTTLSDVDPRLTVRYRLLDRDLPDVKPGSDDSAMWLKGSAGIYHQPPR